MRLFMQLESILHEFTDFLYVEKPPWLVHILMKTVMQRTDLRLPYGSASPTPLPLQRSSAPHP